MRGGSITLNVVKINVKLHWGLPPLSFPSAVPVCLGGAVKVLVPGQLCSLHGSVHFWKALWHCSDKCAMRSDTVQSRKCYYRFILYDTHTVVALITFATEN